ncbi:cysteinyl-tRNA synthetase [Pseudomonas sp. BAY1663]|nr:cysteinyl-tRNA synthetase [Pseudomonas sp. BAY1663]
MTIYNTLSKNKEVFKPLEDNRVRMYVCGMTVYDFCHIGHARVMVAFDVVTRWLRHRGYNVTYVRNITDIDDKIIRRANENGEPFEALVERMIAAMHEDEARLNVLRPDLEPRATAHIGGMFTMIQTLIDKGYAYAPGNGDVYYRVGKFAGYGKLSRRRIEDLKIGARIEVDEAKEDPLDFVLWKGAKPGEPSWQSPWGLGRPGWHIECSVMSTCCLGETFDIHGGGPDLVFPHHENEIAQSEAATGKLYANAWMHAGAVRVDGEKMSKSLGNFFTIREVLEKYHPRWCATCWCPATTAARSTTPRTACARPRAPWSASTTASRGYRWPSRAVATSSSRASARRWTMTSTRRKPARCCSR